ncbi:MAG: peptidylprolyl isomerase, partial [Chthoniobacterales bacterium]|nr:peptidylprolyl isomerase [Chthoniobacterales bacterium]
MINVLRRHQRWLLLVIAIVTIVAFAWLYNDTDLRRLGLSRVAEMYGRTIYQPEVDRIVRLYQLAAVLGLDKFLASLSLTASSEQDALNEFIINYFVLRHESEELWIEPTSQQIVEAIRSLPSLQINGTFDRGRYLSFVQEQLAPRGITERQLEQLIRDSLCLDRIWKIVTSPIAVTLADISSALQQYQKTDVIVVKIPPGNATQLADPTEEEIQKYYESNREMFQIPERRVAEVASFTLDAEQRKLEGKSKVEALQELADRASKFQEVASKGE